MSHGRRASACHAASGWMTGVVWWCCAPFADLFNHSVESTAFLKWDPRQQAVVLQADRSYQPGDEVSR
jgi:hypothetical protein